MAVSKHRKNATRRRVSLSEREIKRLCSAIRFLKGAGMAAQAVRIQNKLTHTEQIHVQKRLKMGFPNTYEHKCKG